MNKTHQWKSAYLTMNKEKKKKERKKSYTRQKLESKKKRKWNIKMKKKKVEGREGNEERKKGIKRNKWAERDLIEEGSYE